MFLFINDVIIKGRLSGKINKKQLTFTFKDDEHLNFYNFRNTVYWDGAFRIKFFSIDSRRKRYKESTTVPDAKFKVGGYPKLSDDIARSFRNRARFNLNFKINRRGLLTDYRCYTQKISSHYKMLDRNSLSRKIKYKRTNYEKQNYEKIRCTRVGVLKRLKFPTRLFKLKYRFAALKIFGDFVKKNI